KVTGAAKYTADLLPAGALIAKVVRSTIANGRVKSFSLDQALAVKGVVRIFTCFDVPDIEFATPGHPYVLDKTKGDVYDRKLLNERVRVYGDDIAVVVATDNVAASRAARLVQVEYEEYPPLLSVEAALSSDATPLHPNLRDTNQLAHSGYRVGEGTYEEAKTSEPGLIEVSGNYSTQSVQHCHLEPPQSYAYMEGNRIVVVTSTQIPHIVRRVVGQALGIPWAQVRIIKPYIGGGFGNKQDVLYEPLNAFLTQQLGGKLVWLELSREETMACTRVRHAIHAKASALARPDGTLVARKIELYSDQGGYASHGHSICANTVTMFKQLYHDQRVTEGDAYTVYTNHATAGAMRGYGIPQSDFFTESLMEDLARRLGADALELRLKNCMPAGYVDPNTGIHAYSNAIRECVAKGRELFHWDEKRARYAAETGDVRRGVGMALFDYKTGVYPISLEVSNCRMFMNEDGSVNLQMGATEIGQGADTVFTQMAAEATGVTEANVHIVSTQDTDVAPFDLGAYASRQTYVSGQAVKRAGEILKQKVLDYAAFKLKKPAEEMDVRADCVVRRAGGEKLLTLAELALEAQYSRERAERLFAEASVDCHENTIATGCTFAEVEVDIPLGKVKILNLLNVHDSGILINPKLAEGQVQGGMSMGIGYALYEELLYDEKGRPLNDNLLDYKLPTALDQPDLQAAFVEVCDPSGPYGNKALGEPPAISPAPAIRNAILQATGVAFNTLPMSPQKLVEGFVQAGLIKEVHPNV
ncbi:MAG TPA: xanthine dehydrogenase molybdenum-binding subunit XdhA, partial [Candidatus Limiplasma sp.]|nr:xanthine dehydrogenase molybdenum-binding subunit XdhA [Candidatus Limiplasma sp.]